MWRQRCQGGTAAAADTATTTNEVVDVKAAMEHTSKKRVTYEGNATVSMKAMQQYEQYQ